MSSITDIKVEETGHLDDVHIDNGGKLNEHDFVAKNEHDIAKIVSELDELEREYMSHVSSWDRFLNMRIPMNFSSGKMLVIVLGCFASFAGLLSGLDQSIISGAREGIIDSLGPSDHEMSLISSLMPLGAMAGSIMMTPLNHFFGRRMSIIISCLWYSVGGGICAGSRSVHMLYAGRFCIGVGVGIEGGCVGIYISECVPPNVRGSIVSMYQFMIALGELIGYAVGAIFFDVKGSWRYMLGSSIVFSSILFAGMYILPESPRWLTSKNRIGRAWGVWKSLRDITVPANLMEFLDMRDTADREKREAQEEKTWERYFELFTIPRNRRALIYASIMIFLGQMTGINAILYNMSRLLDKMHFSPRNSVLMSMVGGGALLIGTIPALLWMDKFGRRVWAQNIVAFLLGLVLVGVGYSISYARHRSAALGVYFTGMILYMGFFGTYACLTWVLPAESFNLRTRAQGMAICSAFLYLWSFIVTYNFDDMQKAMTYTGLTIGFFGGLAVLGFFYQLFFMPETKDKTLEEIDDIFNMKTRDLVAINVKSTVRRFGWIVGKKPARSYNNSANSLAEYPSTEKVGGTASIESAV